MTSIPSIPSPRGPLAYLIPCPYLLMRWPLSVIHHDTTVTSALTNLPRHGHRQGPCSSASDVPRTTYSERESRLVPAQIGFHHEFAELFQRGFRLPAELFLCLGRVANQQLHFRGTIKLGVDAD